MKVAVIFNKRKRAAGEGVINVFGAQNQETYNPATVERVAAALEQGGHNVRVIDGNIHVIEQLQDSCRAYCKAINRAWCLTWPTAYRASAAIRIFRR